tara:strand:- start:543 stop:1082 length:540 start_codon:yes stop_codon:yes gene_type:complete
MVGNLQFIKSATGSDVASVSVTNCFSDNYDVYMVSISKWKYVGTSNAGGMRFIDSGGSVISDSEYDFADLQMRNYAAYQELKPSTFGSSTSTSILCGMDTSNANGPAIHEGFTAYVYNPFNSSSYTFTNFQDASVYDVNNMLPYKGVGVHKSTEQITGINFLNRGTGNISATINVYGVK